LLDNKSIGERLKTARESLKLSRTVFANKGGIDQSQYSKAERGIEGLGPEKLNELMLAHGLNPDYIATGKGEILLSNEREVSLNDIARMLQMILNEQVLTRANILAYGEYEVMKDSKGNPSVREKIMAQINKLVAVNLGELQKKGSRAGGGIQYMESP
jgi:transcriptional regulator with XRE-family HTH domain